ncbi:MAG: hypothetical protein JW774_06480 [Candidatus Aureabacteria bacterium]|nr:hypothetical protein [Candidatus Auribacterota bacterium]
MTDPTPQRGLLHFSLKGNFLILLLLTLNLFMVFIYYNEPFYLPKTVNLSLNNEMLMEGILVPQIQEGIQTGLLIMNPAGDFYQAKEEKQKWIKENPLYYCFPSAKLRYEMTFFTLKTKNRNIHKSGTVIVDTLYPGRASFGYGILDTIEEMILESDSICYLLNGPQLIEKFCQESDSKIWIPAHQPVGQLIKEGRTYIYTGPDCTKKKFELWKNGIYRLVQHFDDMGNALYYEYEKGKPVVIQNNFNEKITIQWNEQGSISSLQNPESQYRFEYDGDNALSAIRSDNKEVIFSVQRNHPLFPHRITHLSFPSHEIELKYGLMGKLCSVSEKNHFFSISFGKNIIKLNRDGNNFWIENIDPFHYTLNKTGEKLDYTFDEKGRILVFTNNKDADISFEYDSKGNLISKKIGKDFYQFTYDETWNILNKVILNGIPVLEKNIKNGLVISENREAGSVDFIRDSQGNIHQIKVGNNDQYTLERNAKGLITCVRHPSGQKSYFSWKNSKLMQARDYFNSIYKLNYDEKGDLFELIFPNGRTYFDLKTFSSSSSDLPCFSRKLKAEKVNYDNRTLDLRSNQGGILSAELDELRRIVAITNRGSFNRKYSYGSSGQLYSIRLDQNSVVYFNREGRMSDFVASDGVCGKIEYVPHSNLLKSSAVEKDLRTYEYDHQGRLTDMNINMVMKYHFKYAPDSSKIYFIQYSDGTKTSYQYNKTGKLESVQYQNSNPVRFRYQEQEQNVEVCFPNGIFQNEGHDEDGRLTTLSITDNAGVALRECNFYYKDGKIVAGSDDGKVIQLKYDSHDHISEYTIQSVDSIQYKLTDTGTVTGMDKMNNTSIQYEYDAMNNNFSMLDSSRQNPINSICVQGKISLGKFNFMEINGVGQMLHESSSFSFDNYPITPGPNRFSFKGMLTSGSTINDVLVFNVHPKACEIFQFNSSNCLQYLCSEGSYEEYEWTSFKQLKTFKNKKGEIYTYQYLPNGNRASMIYDNRTSLFVYDPYGNLIEVISSTGKSLVKYIYDYQRNVLLFSYDGKELRYYHTDAFGSVINISNPAGVITAKYVYSPYGQILSQKEQINDNNVGFLGMIRDSETSLYYSHGGYYDADHILFYPNAYAFFGSDNTSNPMDINTHILPLKIQILPLQNTLLEPLNIPYDISFNQEFQWLDYLKDIEDISSFIPLVTHLTQQEAIS